MLALALLLGPALALTPPSPHPVLSGPVRYDAAIRACSDTDGLTWAWNDDRGTGVVHSAARSMDECIAAVRVARWSSTGLALTGALSTTGDATVGGNLAVTGLALTGALSTTGDATVGGNLAVTGTLSAPGASLTSTLTVTRNGVTSTIDGTSIPSTTIGSLAPVGATSSFAIASNGSDVVYLLSNADKTLFAIDVTTPTAPTLIGSIVTDTNPRDLVVGGNFVYVTGDTGVGRVMRAYDVSNPTVIVAGTNAVGCGQSQGIALQGRFVTCGDRGGQTTWYDVSNPNAPVTAVLSPSTFPAQGLRFYGRFTVSADSTNGNLKVYDPYANAIVSTLGGFSSPRALEVLGEYAYFLETSGLKFHIVSLANPAVPAIASSTVVASAPNALAVTGDIAYVGITNAVLVFDVRVPTAPVQLGSIPVTGIVRGLTLVGNNLYVAAASSPYLQVFAVSATHFEQLSVGGIAARRLSVVGDLTATDARLSGGLTVEQTSAFQRSASFGAQALLAAGTAAAPSQAFTADLTTGAFRVAANDYGIATNGVQRFDVSATATTSTLPFTSSMATASNVTSGTCSSETCTSSTCNAQRGQVTTTCTAGQTTIVTYAATQAATPICTCTAANAAADVITLGDVFCDSSTTALTITTPTAITAGAINYTCFQ